MSGVSSRRKRAGVFRGAKGDGASMVFCTVERHMPINSVLSTCIITAAKATSVLWYHVVHALSYFVIAPPK